MTPIAKPGIALDAFELSVLVSLAEDGLRQRRQMGVGSSQSLRYAADLVAALTALTGRLSSTPDSTPSGRGGTGASIDVDDRDDVREQGPERWASPRQVAEAEACTSKWVRVRAERGEFVGAHRDGSGHWLIPVAYLTNKE